MSAVKVGVSRQVAIPKKLHDQLGLTPGDYLEIELRGMTQCLNLKHPNLVALFDLRTDGLGQHWVVMEYIAGEPLSDVMGRHVDGLPRELTREWFLALARAVGYLHDHGAARAGPLFNAAQKLHLVVLYALAAAAPVTALPAGEVPIYFLGGQGNPRGEALDYNRKAWSVRFAPRQKPVHHFSFTCFLL